MQRSFWQEAGLIIFKAIIIILTVVLLATSLGFMYGLDEYISDGFCNVAVLPVEGVILPYQGLLDVPLVTTPALIEDFLATAEEDSGIQAVLLEINSPGRTPVAAERIAERLRSSNLPVVGLIGDQGASGGYLIAAATDYLLASAMSDVGSIGVDMSYVEESIRNEDEGLTYVQLTAGKFKDIGSPNRPITDEERALLQADLDIVHQHFIDLVAKYRSLDREAVVRLADGSTMPGQRALERGLIDQVGGREEARAALATLLAVEPAEIEFCEYQPPLLPF